MRSGSDWKGEEVENVYTGKVCLGMRRWRRWVEWCQGGATLTLGFVMLSLYSIKSSSSVFAHAPEIFSTYTHKRNTSQTAPLYCILSF